MGKWKCVGTKKRRPERRDDADVNGMGLRGLLLVEHFGCVLFDAAGD